LVPPCHPFVSCSSLCFPGLNLDRTRNYIDGREAEAEAEEVEAELEAEGLKQAVVVV
jgi:hypothetical protein